MDYPQRWLKEHKAITSEKGWIRPTTKELLKCQKGLDIVVEPTLKSVTITGVPAKLNPNVNGDILFTVNYSHLDTEYTPINITYDVTTNGTGKVSSVPPVGKSKDFIIEDTINDEIITVQVTIDGIKSNIMTCKVEIL